MKICKVCLSSDILCGACSKKLERGEIKQAEADLSRVLHSMKKESDIDVDFVQAFEQNDRLFVIVDSKYAGKFIGPRGKNIKKISSVLGKQVKLLEKTTGTEKHVIEKLIGAPILGINKTYSSQNTPNEKTPKASYTSRHADVESFKVRVERRYARNVKPLTDVVGKIIGKKVSFVFE